MIFFKACLESLPKPIRILDVGGYEAFWVNAGFDKREDVEITILNLDLTEVSHKNFTSVVGNGCEMPEFEEDSFDIAFSNSVIEHVYTYESQQKMAKELVRVGKYHYVQTPNKHFAIEPHYLLPFFQYFPGSLKYQILTKTPLSRMHRWEPEFARQYINEIRLISLREFRQLFPSSQVWHEKILGLSKSFVAHNFEI